MSTTYTVIPRTSGDGFDIRVVGADGGVHTILGFLTEEDAGTWIKGDRAISERVEGRFR
jgi:hypothetical protein